MVGSAAISVPSKADPTEPTAHNGVAVMSIRSRIILSVSWATTLAFGSLVFAVPGSAVELTVNSERDAPDAQPGDGVCEIRTGAPGWDSRQ